MIQKSASPKLAPAPSIFASPKKRKSDFVDINGALKSPKRYDRVLDFMEGTSPTKNRKVRLHESPKGTAVPKASQAPTKTIKVRIGKLTSPSKSEKDAWASIFDGDDVAPKVYSENGSYRPVKPEEETKAVAFTFLNRLASIPDEKYQIKPVISQSIPFVKRLKRSYGDQRSYLLASEPIALEEEPAQEFTTNIQDMKAIGHQNALREEVEYLLEDLEHLDESELKQLVDKLLKDVILHKTVPPERIEKCLEQATVQATKHTHLVLVAYFLKRQEMSQIELTITAVDEAILKQYKLLRQKLKDVLEVSEDNCF